MSYEVYRTTAEHIIAAADLALQKPDGIDQHALSAFLEVEVDAALSALKMAEQLGLVKTDSEGRYVVNSPCARYLATSVRDNKAAILRFVLDQYYPFAIFVERLDISTGVIAQAATQTKAICAIDAHRDVIAQTLTDLGTYAQAISSQGAGLHIPTGPGTANHLTVVREAIASRQGVELLLSRRLGVAVFDWIDRNDCLANLITAYQRLENLGEDPRAPIVHAANALEWVLTKLAAENGVDVRAANGINAKADRLGSAGHLKTKHKFMVKYLGHLRNAADHGPDSEIDRQWEVSENTAIEYVHVTLSIIADLYAAKDGRFMV